MQRGRMAALKELQSFSRTGEQKREGNAGFGAHSWAIAGNKSGCQAYCACWRRRAYRTPTWAGATCRPPGCCTVGAPSAPPATRAQSGGTRTRTCRSRRHRCPAAWVAAGRGREGRSGRAAAGAGGGNAPRMEARRHPGSQAAHSWGAACSPVCTCRQRSRCRCAATPGSGLAWACSTGAQRWAVGQQGASGAPRQQMRRSRIHRAHGQLSSWQQHSERRLARTRAGAQCAHPP